VLIFNKIVSCWEMSTYSSSIPIDPILMSRIWHDRKGPPCHVEMEKCVLIWQGGLLHLAMLTAWRPWAPSCSGWWWIWHGKGGVTLISLPCRNGKTCADVARRITPPCNIDSLEATALLLVLWMRVGGEPVSPQSPVYSKRLVSKYIS